MADLRIKWIGERALSFLGLDDYDLFNNMLEAENKLSEKLIDFVNAPITGPEKTLDKVIFYIHRTYYDKMVEVEKEITEWRIVPPKVTIVTPPQSSKKKGKGKEKGKPKPKAVLTKKDSENLKSELEMSVDDNKNEEGDIIKDDPKPEEDTKIISLDSSSQKTPPSLDPEVEGTIEYYTLKRFVPTMMKLPRLNGNFGEEKIDDEKANTKFIYFIRNHEDPLPQPSTESLAKLIMPKYFLVGSCDGRFLNSILLKLKKAYIHIFESNPNIDQILSDTHMNAISHDSIELEKNHRRPSHYFISSQTAFKETTEARIKSILKVESKENEGHKLPHENKLSEINISNDLIILNDSIERLTENVDRENRLPIPNIQDLNDKTKSNEDLAKDPDLVETLATTLKSWSATITACIDISNIKNLLTGGPMAEYEFWNSQNETVMKMIDHLQTASAQQIINILRLANSPTVKKIEEKQGKLEKYGKTASNNVKLLFTSLEHFQILKESSDLKIVAEQIPGLVHGLNMLWMLSKYYCKDEQMLPLLESVANCLCSKIEIHLAVENLFSNTFNDVLDLTRDGKLMLENWRESYAKTRKKIEATGKGARWEFDVKKLFQRTNYLATVCDDISKVAQILIEFENILGDEIQTLAPDQSEIDEIYHCIRHLVNPIKTVDFSVFIPDNKENWDVIVNDFNKDVAVLEIKIKNFIDKLFDNLQSSEEALYMLSRCIEFETRQLIHEQLITKFDYVWEQFIKEIKNEQQSFETQNCDPPLSKNQPNIAGAIFWSWALKNKTDHKLMNFEKNHNMSISERKKSAFNEYQMFVTGVKKYFDSKFNQWLKQSSQIMKTNMKDNLLKLVEANPSLKKPSKEQLQSVRNKLWESKKNMRKNKRTSNSTSLDTLFLDRNKRVELNFEKKNYEIMEEMTLLEFLGFKIPIHIKQYCLQGDMLHTQMEILENIISQYNNLSEALKPFEKKLIQQHLRKFEKCIFPGTDRITWLSLGMPDFITRSKKGLSIVKSKNKLLIMSTFEIENLLGQMKNFNMFPVSSPSNENSLHSCKTFFANMEQYRTKEEVLMIKIYEDISNYLIKLEFDMLTTTSGESHVMHDVYKNWETKIFDTFIKYCINNMKNFTLQLKSNSCIFQVDAMLQASEVIMSPSLSEIHNILLFNINDFIIRFKNFHRWVKGSCNISLPIFDVEQEYQAVSFYEDVVKESKIHSIVSFLLKTIEKTARNANNYIKKWSKYKLLWSFDKQSSCEKYTNKYTDIIKFDERLSFFQNIVNELEAHVKFKDIGPIRINLRPIIVQIQDHAKEWKRTLGKCLILCTKEKIAQLSKIIAKLRTNLNTNIKKLTDYKLVTLTIDQIKSMTISSEVIYKSAQEVFYMLKNHDIELSDNDIVQSKRLQEDWYNLYISMLFRFEKLNSVRNNFSNQTASIVRQFTEEVAKFIENFISKGPGTLDKNLDEGVLMMENYSKIIEMIEVKKNLLQKSEKIFTNPLADYSNFVKIKLDFENLTILYEIYKNFKKMREELSKVLWTDLEIQLLVTSNDSIRKDFRKLSKETRELPCGIALKKQTDDFKNVIPLLELLKNEAVKNRHWSDLLGIMKNPMQMNFSSFTLKDAFELNLNKFRTDVETVVTKAVKELSIERDIENFRTTWENLNFTFSPHSKGNIDRGFTITSYDDIISTLEDHCMNIQIMGASQFIGEFLAELQKWDIALSTVSVVLEHWIETQNKWLYLESIFIGTDIRSKLPEETKEFDEYDNMYLKVMEQAVELQNVKTCCLIPDLSKIFIDVCHGLDKCQKALLNYVDSKRRIFPRFFFISNDELLSILGNSYPSAIQEYINKLFNNVNQIRITEDSNLQPICTGLISSENEILDFQNDVLLTGYIEDWMNLIVKEMTIANRLLTKKAVFDYGISFHDSRTDWILQNLGMVSLVSDTVWWTAETENAFIKVRNEDPNAMKKLLENLNDSLKEIVFSVRKDISPNDYKKLKAIITIDVHSKDIIESFVMNHVVSSEQFEWESQLRFYWMKHIDNLQIQQCTGIFEYGYEYMGLNGRLVITPLTDRIYLTITQALTMYLGTAPAGPAGTGKTETVKDLAKVMALLCMVTNCGENLNFQMMGQIFSGLCSCGAWGCFDEFNRIDISVLSVVSTQLHSIKTALMTKMPTFMFEGVKTVLNKSVGVFITMNPGYAGRTELPESLKVFFRPVMCIVPDLEIICQISLFSDGFLEAKILAKKITMLYKLARDQLSKQSHYDWGLRALTALLRMSGMLKRSNPDDSESGVLLKAMRNINQPKFVLDDVVLFLNLVKDLFPGCEYVSEVNLDWETAIAQVMESEKLVVLPFQIEKIIQLNKTLMTQHSAMLVGSTGGGKSCMIDVFVKTQNLLGIKAEITILNPKALTVNELYGVQNFLTREWTDGLLSFIFRNINKVDMQNGKHYLLFDGDVDALWIENMNSVMDDNKLLTLANGERIQLAKHCSLLFEVGDLMYASPATVSRAGMIYVDTKNFGYIPYWECWLAKRSNEDEKKKLQELFKQFVPDTVNFVYHGLMGLQEIRPLKFVILQTPLNSIIQLCYMLEALTPEKETPYDDNTMLCCFLMSIYYSFGAVIDKENREEFDGFIKKLSPLTPMADTTEQKATTFYYPKSFPTLFDYYLDVENKCWNAWQWLTPPYVHDESIEFNDILVPTVDTLRIAWMIEMMNSVNRPLLITGDTGTSKTAIITHFLKNLSSDTHVSMKLNFSSRTKSADIQTPLESVLEKRTKNIYGPPVGKKLIVFIDDMNMPEVDKYGTQMPIAFLKLLFEKSGFYERTKNLDWRQMIDTLYIAAMGKSGGGRNDVDPRFISKFSVINLAVPANETLNLIYLSILSGHFQAFDKSIQEIAPKLINITLQLFKILQSDLPPTPSRFHYVFNLRDLSRIVYGMSLTHPNLFPEIKFIVRAWRNEFYRVMCDRLICPEDRDLIENHITSLITQNFNGEVSKTAETKSVRQSEPPNTTSGRESIPDSGTAEISEEGDDDSIDENKKLQTLQDYILRDPVLFGDFRNALSGDVRYYEDLLDYDAVYYLLQEILEDYNENQEKMPLILFEHCLEHVTRIHRILRMKRGHMLLVGTSASGKRSMVKLASYAAGATIFEITPSHNYNESSFKEDLKQLYNLVGIEKKKIVFLLSSTQILEESFLDLLNNMLVNGIISTLFTEEEKDVVINMSREEAMQHNCRTRDSIWKYFCNICTNNLNVVFTTVPGELLRKRCSNFPGLISCTTIDWLDAWPQQALLAVANNYLTEIADLPEQHKEQLVQYIIYVHESADAYSAEYLAQLKRYNYVTPYHFITFISNFLKVLEEKEKSIASQCQRFENGILKIDDANVEIVNLNAQLESQKVILEKQNKHVAKLQSEIFEAKEKANAKKDFASKKTAEIMEKNVIIIAKKKEAEEILKAAMPALEKARLALENLDKADITEIRSFATPPDDVQVVAECILIVRGYEEINWKAARGMMSDPNFLKHLLEMNFDEITPAQLKAARAHMKKIKKIQVMKRVSKAGFGLLTFLQSILEYCDIFQEVKPKRDKVIALEKEFNEAKNNLEKLNEEILNITDQLKTLNNKHKETTKVEQELQETTNKMLKRLTAADKLIIGLRSEKIRWQELLVTLDVEKSKLIGTCLLSSAFFNYLGPFTYEYRCKIIYNDWLVDLQRRNIPVYTPYKIEDHLTNDVETSKWQSEGLPLDEFSIQNGILTVHSKCYPLCIDPQSQALGWIKTREMNNSLKVITLNDSNYLRVLEIAIKSGQPVLIQDISNDNLKPILYDLFEKNVRVQHGREFIRLGSLEVDYNPNFRLYLTTKLTNPKFSPTVYTKLVIINYLATFSCLEEQLLRLVIINEKPELETQRAMLIEQTSTNKTALRQLEDSLLMELSMTTDNILDNEELVAVLEDAQNKVQQITKELKLAKETTEQINQFRLAFMPVATRGALLFFTLLDMTSVNFMYQYSLISYFDVFLLSVKNNPPEENLEIKLRNIIEKLTYDIYEYCGTGIFDEHTLLLAFQIAVNLGKKNNELSQLQVDVFIKGSSMIDESEQTCPIPWMPNEIWKNVKNLGKDFPELFSRLFSDINDSQSDWEQWYTNDQPEFLDYPNEYSSKLSPFDKLLLLRSFRVDRVHNAMKIYIKEALGERFSVAPSLRLKNIYDQTTAQSVVIFILTVGSDPTALISKLSDELGFEGAKTQYVSLGQGQEKIALHHLESSIAEGKWLVIQNCHLLPVFLIELEKCLNGMANPNPDFRIWLTTEPTPRFPIGILQRAIKVVTEAPSGLKPNLKNTYIKLQEETLEKCTHPAYKKVIYVIAFFHAVLQERRKYDKIGWNVSYDFNETDQTICFSLLEYYLEKSQIHNEDIPWETLKFLFGEIMYGGRVSDNFDRRILNTYIDEYFGDFLFDKFQEFYFFINNRAEFKLPMDNTKEKYIEFIDDLPTFDSPEIYGLHSNSEIVYYTRSIRKIWDNLIDMQTESGASSSQLHRDDIISNIAQEILNKIPQQFNIPKVKKQFEMNLTPSSIVLLQELERFNRLSETMEKTLKVLIKALAGEIETNVLLESIANSLYNGRLPAEWSKLTSQTNKTLAAWISHFTKRTLQYESWATKEEPLVIWLSGLHVPESLLVAHMQTACRLQTWPLETCSHVTDVTEFTDPNEVEQRPPIGVYINGLYLEGARWDVADDCLKESHPKVLITELPIVHIVPVKTANYNKREYLTTPVYTTSLRRNAMGVGLVFECQLKTLEHNSKWILQGVCLIMNTD